MDNNITIDNIGEHLNNNPEEKDIIEEQPIYFFPKWINAKYKDSFVDNLPPKDKDFILQLLLQSSISEKDIEFYDTVLHLTYNSSP